MSSDKYTQLHSRALKNKCNERGLFALGTDQDRIARLLESSSPKYHSPHAKDLAHRPPLSPSNPVNPLSFKFPSDSNLHSNTHPLNHISYKSTQSLTIEITSSQRKHSQKENNPHSANKHQRSPRSPRYNPKYSGNPSYHKTKTLPPNPPMNKLLSLPLGMLQSETSLLRESSQDTEDTMEFKEDEFQRLRSKSVESHHSHKRDTFAAFDRQLKGLHDVIKGHLNLILRQIPKVDKYIQSLQQTEIAAVNMAKEKALQTEKKLLHEIIDNVPAMNMFLNEIILIENGFNALYTKKEQENQKRARQKWAKHITAYENKQRPISKTESFIDLVFKGALYLSTFKEWLANLQQKCHENDIRIVQTSGATAKNVDRSFYKVFFLYGGDFNQMTDMLRCSLVFDDFDDLYHCFRVIQTITRNNGGILRCKDRFDPETMPFGYRNLLINIYCPESKMVCEIQLHHAIFYQHKDVSHNMYTKARLFETTEGNLACKYANKYNRKQIGTHTSQDMQNEDNLEAIQLLKKWKLEKYENALINVGGWCDVNYWWKLTTKQLINGMKFKPGEAVKFMEEVKQIISRKRCNKSCSI